MPPHRKKSEDVWTGRRKEKGYFKPRPDERRQGPLTEFDHELDAARTTRRSDVPIDKKHEVRKRRSPEEKEADGSNYL